MAVDTLRVDPHEYMDAVTGPLGDLRCRNPAFSQSDTAACRRLYGTLARGERICEGFCAFCRASRNSNVYVLLGTGCPPANTYIPPGPRRVTKSRPSRPVPNSSRCRASNSARGGATGASRLAVLARGLSPDSPRPVRVAPVMPDTYGGPGQVKPSSTTLNRWTLVFHPPASAVLSPGDRVPRARAPRRSR